MVEGLAIERVSTEIEKQNMSVIGQMTPQKFFAKKLAEVEQKFAKEHLPFDGQCARLDFKDEIERIVRESERAVGYVKEDDIKKLNVDDLEKYGDAKLFEEVRVDEDTEFVIVNGIRTPTKAGYTVQYKCKNRGHGISVFMPVDVYEERFKKKEIKEVKE